MKKMAHRTFSPYIGYKYLSQRHKEHGGTEMKENEIGSMVVNTAIELQLTYLKLSNIKIGYIINFGAEVLKDGIVRIINGVLD